jgi:acyl carrier protein
MESIYMENVILKYIIEQFGSERVSGDRTQHYSYCTFPESECTCKDLEEINYETPLISGGYIDSFSMVVVLIFLEKTFKVKILEEQAIPENFNTINKMVKLINQCKDGRE